MSDNVAILSGYTQEWIAECAEYDLNVFVKPDTDLDSTFKDNCEFIIMNGWLWSFVPV